MQTIVLHFLISCLDTPLLDCLWHIFHRSFLKLRLHTNKRRPCSSTLSGHPSSSRYGIPLPVMGGKRGIVFPRCLDQLLDQQESKKHFSAICWVNAPFFGDHIQWPSWPCQSQFFQPLPRWSTKLLGRQHSAPRESSPAQTCQALFLPEDFWWFGGGIWCPLEILVKVWWSCRSFARAKADLKHNDQLVDTVRSFARDQSCFYFDSWHRQRCNLKSEKAGWTFAGNSCLSKTSYRIHWVIKPVPGTSGFSLKLQSHICISAEQCQTLSQGSVCKDMHHANFSAVSFAAAMCSLSSTGSRCFFVTWFFMCSNTK